MSKSQKGMYLYSHIKILKHEKLNHILLWLNQHVIKLFLRKLGEEEEKNKHKSQDRGM
jgi:hypothetical protein